MVSLRGISLDWSNHRSDQLFVGTLEALIGMRVLLKLIAEPAAVLPISSMGLRMFLSPLRAYPAPQLDGSVLEISSLTP